MRNSVVECVLSTHEAPGSIPAPPLEDLYWGRQQPTRRVFHFLMKVMAQAVKNLPAMWETRV